MTTAGRPDDPSVADAAGVARAVGADLDRGLTAAEASQRLAQNGRNELRGAPPVPTWRRVLAHFQDPLIYLLLAAIAIALTAWWLEGRSGWPVDVIVIAVGQRVAQARHSGSGVTRDMKFLRGANITILVG